MGIIHQKKKSSNRNAPNDADPAALAMHSSQTIAEHGGKDDADKADGTGYYHLCLRRRWTVTASYD